MEELGLKNTTLTILKSQDDSSVRADIDNLKEMYMNSHNLLSSRDATIKEKDLRISELEKDLRRYYASEIRFDRIVNEIKINYGDLKTISFAREYSTNFEKMDTLNIITVSWKGKVNKRRRNEMEKNLKQWLETRLRLKNIEVRRTN